MYITAATSASSLLRASRSRFISSLSSFKTSSSPPKVSPSSFITHRSLSLSSAGRSLRCSVPRWSHGVDWRSPLSLRAQIRTVSPIIDRLERTFTTMGTVLCLAVTFVPIFLELCFDWISWVKLTVINNYLKIVIIKWEIALRKLCVSQRFSCHEYYEL